MRLLLLIHNFIKSNLQRLQAGDLTWQQKAVIFISLFPVSPTLGLVTYISRNFFKYSLAGLLAIYSFLV